MNARRRLLFLCALGAATLRTAGGAMTAAPETAKPRLAIVIDDFGLTYPKNVPDEKWLAIKWPISYAVMPESPRTKAVAARIKEAGQELLIHFPFDPFLSLELPKDRLAAEDLAKVERLLEKSFRQIPGPAGLNNHRSYRGTRNEPLMRAFMERFKSRGVYFLDSKVSAKSVAYAEARRAGIAAASNDIFIDTAEIHDKPFCQKMLRRAAGIARRKGFAIAIGHHYFHGTYDCLLEEAPKLQAEGIELVFVSALLERGETALVRTRADAAAPRARK